MGNHLQQFVARPHRPLFAADAFLEGSGSSGQNPGGDSAQIKNSYWQGGLFTTSDIELDTTSQVEGPMLASTEIVGQSIQSHAWATITSVPAGAPSTAVVYSQPDPPADFRG